MINTMGIPAAVVPLAPSLSQGSTNPAMETVFAFMAANVWNQEIAILRQIGHL
jgi:hypothetical protein